MKVVLEKVFPLAATADNAWQLMQDIEAVAGCMPGAKITERIDATHYKGTITVRLGPATMSFKGDIEVVNLDAAARSLHLIGKGSDATGTSAASMDLVAAVQATGETCELTGKSEVTMSGKAASLGGRLMGPVSEQLLKQFVANFAARLQSLPVQQNASSASAATEGSQPSLPVTPDIAVATKGSQPPSPVAPEVAMPTEGDQPPRPVMPEAAAPTSELNGFSLAWAVIRDWLRGIFSRKTA